MSNLVKVLFMAFAAGQESKEFVIRRYIGVAPVYILAVNPSKAELEKIYGTQMPNEPTYVGKTTINGVEYPQIRLDFIVKSNAEKCNGIEMTSKVSFFLTKAPWISSAGTKVQMINKYGETFWITLEEAEKMEVSTSKVIYSTEGMRKAYRGEADLVDFLKNFLVIPGPTFRDNNTGEWKPIKNLADAEAQLGRVEDYFKGDVSEIREVIGSQLGNQVKLCFGVRTTDDNKQYQDVFIRKTLRLRVTDYSKLDEEIQLAKNNGSYPNTEFSVEPLHEYVVGATAFKAPETQQEAPKAQGNWFN